METQARKSIKKPFIRQTKASIYRLAIANPSLVEENQITVADKNIFLPPAVVGRRLTIADIEFAKFCKENSVKGLDIGKMSIDACTNQSGKASNNLIATSSSILKQNNNIVRKTGDTKFVKYEQQFEKPAQKSKDKPQIKCPSISCDELASFNQHNFVSSTPIVKQSSNAAAPIAKILAKNNIDMVEKIRKDANNVCVKQRGNTSRKNSSPTVTNILKQKSNGSLGDNDPKSMKNEPQFKKPFDKVNIKPQNLRRSYSSQHLTSFNIHRRSFVSSTPVRKQLPDTIFNRLHQPLKDWLKTKNKSLSNFHHLKCFGLQHLSEEAKDEVKENIDVGFVRSSSYDSLNIPQNEQNEEKNKTAFAENIVNGAIEDLYNLLVAGYSPEQCEAWLNFIRQQYKKVEGQPQYWECRAEIEQRRGNITSAIEALKNSIINGANVEHIDESLGQLLDKFSVLNIETSKSEKSDSKQEEVRNIFKSTIIQFAIEKRSQKENKNYTTPIEGKVVFIATPVRRSTRKSCGKFQHTPGKKIVNSLNDLDPSIKENLQFENNAYLA